MKHLSTVLLRISGLAFVAFALINIAGYSPFLISGNQYSTEDVISIFLSNAFFPLLFAYILLCHTGFIQKSLKLQGDLNISKPDELERIALSTLGMFLVFYAISDLSYYFAELWKLRELQAAGMIINETDIMLLSPEKHGLIMATLIELIFALYLVVGSKGLVTLLQRLRN